MRFLFDGHVLDTGRRELRLGGGSVVLEPLVFDLLVYLVANRHRVVSRDDLLEAVWSGRIVSESALASRIAAARRAVGDSGETQRLIRTIARRGFRFVGEVREEEAPVQGGVSTAPAAEPDPAWVPDRPSIAVLPFANLSGDPEQEYLSDGVADDIVTALAHDRSLFVIARNSSFTYRGRAVDVGTVAREMGVRYVLEGSARRDGGRIKVNARLTDAVAGGHIWAGCYDRAATALFAVQDQITAAVVCAIVPEMANAERQRALRKAPGDLSAWEAWHRALWHWSAHDLPGSRDFFRLAVARDPRFAPPHAMLAWLRLSESTLGVGPPLRETAILAHSEARTAIELDPGGAIGHAMLAWVLDHQGRPGPALEEAEAAIALNANDSQGHLVKGHILLHSGRPVEAREPLATALRLDPRGPTSATVLQHRAIGCYLERDYPSAEAFAHRALRAWPRFPRPYPWLAATLGQLGRADEAREALRAVTEAAPGYLGYLTGTRPLYHRPEDHEHLLEGLRKAGWPG